MIGKYKLIDVGRNMLTSISNVNINKSYIDDNNIDISNIENGHLIAEYKIYVAKRSDDDDGSHSDVQISGSFGVNILNCQNSTIRVIITSMLTINKETIIYTIDNSLNNHTNVPKYKLISFTTLIGGQYNLIEPGHYTHRLYIICDTPIKVIGPITFQGLSFSSSVPNNVQDNISSNNDDNIIDYKETLHPKITTITKIINDTNYDDQVTAIPFASGNKLELQINNIYLSSYGNYLQIKNSNLDPELDIVEPYGAICVPKKAVYRGLSCRFTYKGNNTFFPFSRVSIKIGIYINNPDKGNKFTKISEHTVADLDHGDVINVDQLFSIADNSINRTIDKKTRIIPVFSVLCDDSSDNGIIGYYAGNIFLE